MWYEVEIFVIGMSYEDMDNSSILIAPVMLHHASPIYTCSDHYFWNVVLYFYTEL